MLGALFDLAGDRFGVRLPRRWDGKNVSGKGTLRSGFRVVAGVQAGVGTRWALYATAVSPGHLWIGRTSVYVDDVAVQPARPPRGDELMSLDRDFVVVPLLTRTNTRLEWAVRASALDEVIARLGVG